MWDRHQFVLAWMLKIKCAVSIIPNAWSRLYVMQFISANTFETMFNTVPDENYAREVMQLETVGLEMLNMDGSE